MSAVSVDLEALKALHADAEAARADLDNDFPVGAVARGKWQDARRAMADAAPALIARVEELDDALRLCVTMLETVNDNLVSVMEKNWNARLKALTHARAALGIVSNKDDGASA